MAEWTGYQERMLVKLRLRGMTPTLIALTMDKPYDEVIAVMDRMKLTRKRRDRPFVVNPDYVVIRSPSPPRQFSWQQ